jgi:DeoR family transcriptional regulator of aga operon
VGVDGIDVRAGCTTHHAVEAHSNGAMIGRARQVVVVADSSKIGHIAFATICPVDAVTLVISDTDAGPQAVKALEEAGPEVHLV